MAAENSALCHKSKLHFKIYSNRKYVQNAKIVLFLLYFDQINADNLKLIKYI